MSKNPHGSSFVDTSSGEIIYNPHPAITNQRIYSKSQKKVHHIKMVRYGPVVDIYRFGNGVMTGKTPLNGRTVKPSAKQEEHREHTIKEIRRRVIQLVLANFDNKDKFVTLTFAENMIDITEANKHFDNFIKRLRRRYKDLKYLAVIEFQQRGAVHYHMIIKLPYVSKADLQTLWGQGFIKINAIDKVDNVGAYISKYMTVELGDIRLKGRKSYLRSQHLNEPETLYGTPAEALEVILGLGDIIKPTYTTQYQSEYAGLVKYDSYNILRPSGQR